MYSRRTINSSASRIRRSVKLFCQTGNADPTRCEKPPLINPTARSIVMPCGVINRCT
jgi:hypothetical protein